MRVCSIVQSIVIICLMNCVVCFFILVGLIFLLITIGFLPKNDFSVS